MTLRESPASCAKIHALRFVRHTTIKWLEKVASKSACIANSINVLPTIQMVPIDVQAGCYRSRTTEEEDSKGTTKQPPSPVQPKPRKRHKQTATMPATAAMPPNGRNAANGGSFST
jgi:hypothetical protein